MDRFKTKLNSSVTLGKTAIRKPTPHSKSFVIDSAEHTLTHPLRSSSKGRKRAQSGSIHKAVSIKGVPPKQLSVAGSIALVHHNRKYCQQMSTELQQSVIGKTIKINKMMRQLSHLMSCLGDLKWLLAEGDRLMQMHLKETMLLAPESVHTQNITQLAKEFKSLMLRFGNIDKPSLKNIEEWLKMNQSEGQQNTRLSNTQLSPFEDGRPTLQRRQAGSIEGLAQIREELSDGRQAYSMPMKQNYNRSNFSTHFQNIKLIPSKVIQEKTPSPEPIIRQNYMTQQRDLQEQLQHQKEQLYDKLREQYRANQELAAINETLREELTLKEAKATQNKVAASKSIEQMGQILRKLVNSQNCSDRQFQLLRMAQCLTSWEEMLEDDREAVHHRHIFGDDDAINTQRTQKLQELIGLQYDINHLLGQKRSLQRNSSQHKFSINVDTDGEDLYRMLSVQAICLQQLCCQ